jgi:hypothetical protein
MADEQPERIEKPNGALLFTVIVLRHGGEYLLLERRVLPPCPEGTFAWVLPGQMLDLPLIDNARPLLPLLFADQERDPTGTEPLALGLARFAPDGTFLDILWA